MITDTEIIPRQTVAQMVDNYKQARIEIEQGYALLQVAQDRLRASFGDTCRFDTITRDDWGTPSERTKAVFERLKREAWAVLAERCQLRQVLSCKREQELSKQLDSGEGLPEIETETVFGMMDSLLRNVDTYLEECVQEVFEWLRPTGDKYKTNSQFEVGRRVILGWCVERCGYSGHPFRVNYHRRQNLRGLDNVFHMLDGRGPIKSHCGPLYDAIEASSDGTGATDLFKFRCCANGNLHIEFLRLDLVRKLNEIAGGNRLRAETKDGQEKGLVLV